MCAGRQDDSDVAAGDWLRAVHVYCAALRHCLAIVHTELAGELPSFGRGLEGLVHNDVKVSQTFTLRHVDKSIVVIIVIVGVGSSSSPQQY